MPGARRQGRGGPLGAHAVEQVHQRARGPGRLARAPHVQERARGADARRLAHGGRNLQASLRRPRGPRRPRPLRRAQEHRHRRDQLQEGPQVHDRGGGPRPQQGRVGREGPRQETAQRLPRPAHARAASRHRGRHRRRGALDRRRRRGAPARGRARRRPLPRRQLGHRRARRAEEARVERGQVEARAQAAPGTPQEGRGGIPRTRPDRSRGSGSRCSGTPRTSPRGRRRRSRG